MNVVLTGQSFVLNQFREFYRELVSLKRQAMQGRLEELVPLDNTGKVVEQANPIWIRVVAKMQDLARQAGHQGSPCTAESYKEAQYVMAAMADETFLHVDWSGREWWRGNLVETKFFQSHIAGERIFQRIGKMLENRESVCVELAALYLLSLSLGFQGKFRGEVDQGAIARMRRELFHVIAHRDPDFLQGSTPMFPESYAHTLEQSALMKLPDPRKWLWGVGACLAGYVLVAHVLWTYLTEDVTTLVNSILSLG